MNRDEVISKLQEISQQLGGKRLTEEDITKGGLPRYQWGKYFGDVGFALKAAGLQPTKHSVSRATTNDDLLDHLDDLWRQLGHQPRVRDVAKDGRFTERLIRGRFGSFSKAISQVKERQALVEERPGLPEQPILALEDLSVQSQSFANDMLQAALKHERLWQQRLQDAEDRIRRLEQEKRELERAPVGAKGPRAVVVKLREILNERCDEDDLRVICHQLGLDYDDLPSHSKAAKTVKLIDRFERRDQIQDLVDAIGKLRPDIDIQSELRKEIAGW